MDLHVHSVCTMADIMSLLLEARACAGSDKMFKGCVRASPLRGEPCAGSSPACWWAFLRSCQRRHDNGHSIQNHSRSTDGSGGIDVIPIETTHAQIQYTGSSRHYIILKRWEVRAAFSVQEIKHSHHVWPSDLDSRELNAPQRAQTQRCFLQSLQSHAEFHRFGYFNIQDIE